MLHHVSLGTDNLQRARRFYRELLHSRPPRGYPRPWSLPPGPISWPKAPRPSSGAFAYVWQIPLRQ
jgi:catechol 2,3-dioxygenase-like lactoylglutathione lyase family enzyme